MRYVYLANNRLGLMVLRWLVDTGRPPAGVVVHPDGRAKLADEIVAASGLPAESVLRAPMLRTSAGKAWLSALAPDWAVSVMFGYLISDALLAIPRRGTVNLHPGLLPYNRGAYPNVWSIVEGTPAGVTLHLVEPGQAVDAGPIVAQAEVPVGPADTGASVYAKLETAALALFRAAWPLIEAGDPPRRAQEGDGTSHTVGDVAAIDPIDPDALVRAGHLLDILRARTFPGYDGAYLRLPGKRVYIRVELEERPEP